ncbi:MAG: 50S ribosomal protein L24 [Planctomycetes bacterium]|nr:50S ribosomal protein L24 [Planctomycetota bacterium]
MHVRKNDNVKVMSGDDRGKEGRVVRVITKTDRLVVQGINLVFKHVKRSMDYPHGARIQKEAPIAASRVLLVCPACNRPTRVSMTPAKDGRRARTCKKCKQAITVEE